MSYPSKSSGGQPGSPGSPGAPGSDGVGVASSQVRYAVSSSGASIPQSGWQASIPQVSEGQYLWSRMVISYTDGSGSTVYSVAYSAVDGAPGSPGSPGSPGNPGAAGVGVTSSSVSYQASSSASSAPSGSWSSTVPALTKGQYLWARTSISYSDSTSSTMYSVSYLGLDGSPGSLGSPGSPGAPGVGLSSSAVSYAASSSGTATPTSGWGSVVPSVSKGQYLWSRTILTMTDGSTSTTYSVSYFATDGSPGSAGTPGTNGTSYTPQPPAPRTISIATAYQHTDVTKGYKVAVNARATQTVTLAGTIGDKIELRVGPTAASVVPGGTGGFPVGVWESGITGIALMVGAAVADGGQLTADVQAGWYFSVNRLAGTTATIVSCYTQSLSP